MSFATTDSNSQPLPLADDLFETIANIIDENISIQNENQKLLISILETSRNTAMGMLKDSNCNKNIIIDMLLSYQMMAIKAVENHSSTQYMVQHGLTRLLNMRTEFNVKHQKVNRTIPSYDNEKITNTAWEASDDQPYNCATTRKLERKENCSHSHQNNNNNHKSPNQEMSTLITPLGMKKSGESSTIPPWLKLVGTKCYSAPQLSSNQNLSTVKKRYHQCQCIYCESYAPLNPWAELRSRQYSRFVWQRHENSSEHQEAANRYNQHHKK